MTPKPLKIQPRFARFLKWLSILLAGAAFVGGFLASIRPLDAMLEIRWIRSVEGGIPGSFPVLVRPSGDAQAYRVVYWGEITDDESPVTDVASLDEDEVNRRLAESIPFDPGSHRYFSIVETGHDWVDVMVEVPTQRATRSRAWYRIQDDGILPQRKLFLGAGYGMVVGFCGLFAGGMCALASGALARWLLVLRR